MSQKFLDAILPDPSSHTALAGQARLGWLADFLRNHAEGGMSRRIGQPPQGIVQNI
jgi:hypothetical protein